MPFGLGLFAAAGAGGASASSFDHLETVVLGSSATSVTFSNLGSYSAYKHLQLRCLSVNTNTNQDHLKLTFNGDNSASYADHNMSGSGTAVSSGNSPSQAFIRILFANAYSGSPGYAAAIIDILDFASTSKNTTTRSLTGYDWPTQRTRITLLSGLWNNTSAVTSMTIAAFSDSLTANSRFSLYGLKG